MSDSEMKTPLSRRNSFQAEKLSFLKWICGSTIVEELPFDIPEISVVLQAMGFQLEKYERTLQNTEEELDNGNDIKITLQCTKSKMCAVLTKSEMACKCPNLPNFHCSIVGDEDPSANKEPVNINESPNLVLPIISKGRSLLIKEIISKLLTLVSSTDINKNDDKMNVSSKLRREHSLDNLFEGPTEKQNPMLLRRKSWEVDPKTSPPASTSSPLPESCKSQDQSSGSDREHMLTQLLSDMEEKLKKAISLLPTKNNTFTMKKTLKRVSDIKKSPLLPSPTRSTTGDSTRDLFLKMTPKKTLTPSKAPVAGERKLLVPSKISSFRKKIGKTATPNKSKQYVDTPRPLPQSEKKNTFAIKSSTLRSSNPNLASAAGTSGISKVKSGIPALNSKLTKPGSMSTLTLKRFK